MRQILKPARQAQAAPGTISMPGSVTRFRPGDAVDFGELTWAEGFVGIEAPDAFEQSLSPQDFM